MSTNHTPKYKASRQRRKDYTIGQTPFIQWPSTDGGNCRLFCQLWNSPSDIFDAEAAEHARAISFDVVVEIIGRAGEQGFIRDGKGFVFNERYAATCRDKELRCDKQGTN